MTTLNAATAWHFKKPLLIAAIVGFIAVGLGGCETGSNLLGSSGSSAPTTDLTSTATAAPPPAPGTIAPLMAKVAVAPVIGAPDNVARDLQSQLSLQIEAQRITVAKTANDKSELTLRGYVVSAREKTGAKISYIWDVTDTAGRRVNRISGEEVIPGSANKDPWTAVTPQVTQSIASKAASQFATWLPTYGAAPAVASAAPLTPAPLTPVAAPLAPAATTPAVATAASPPVTPAVASAAPIAATATATTTGSIDPNGSSAAIVPAVTGAPGDGSVSLTSAIQRELSRSGVTLAGAPGGQTYRVEGKVTMGAAKDGKQPIQIDWNVRDPKGKSLGVVSQKNQITQGTLDGAWGKTADLAASAAVQGILKLLPQGKQQQAGSVTPAATAN